MKTTLAILTATAAIAAFLAMPAISAVYTHGTDDAAMSTDAPANPASGLLASNDDDHKSYLRYRSDDDGEDYDDDDGGHASAAPAPAGAVPPPDNGLFDTGATPKVQVN